MKMEPLSNAIENYINNFIALSGKDISNTIRTRDWFLARLLNEIKRRQHEPSLFNEKPFVFYGSYTKKTKVADVDEMDVLIVIDSCSGQYSNSGVKIGEGLGNENPNNKYKQKYFKTDGSGISPNKMLNWLKGIVNDVITVHGGQLSERRGEAVSVYFSSNDLILDLIPAGIFRRVSNGEIFYNIPKGDINNGWIETSPKLDIDRLNNAAVNKENFRNVIRLVKRIRDKYNMKISSFSIETSLINYWGINEWSNNIYIDLIKSLIGLSENLMNGSIIDPFDSNKNLISDVEKDTLIYYAKRILKLVDDLLELKHLTDPTLVYNKVSKIFENE